MSQKKTLRCEACDEQIESEKDAVYGAGSLKQDGAEQLADGEKVGFDELFGFDDGPYCSLDCSMEGDS